MEEGITGEYTQGTSRTSSKEITEKGELVIVLVRDIYLMNTSSIRYIHLRRLTFPLQYLKTSLTIEWTFL